MGDDGSERGWCTAGLQGQRLGSTPVIVACAARGLISGVTP